MHRKLASLLAALATAAALAGCKKDAQVESALAEFHAFTEEIVKRVEGGANPSAGVDDAQKYFDSRKAEILAKLESLKGVRGFQVSEQTKKKMTEQLADGYMSVTKLQLRYMMDSVRDPALKAKLDKLVQDYQGLIRSTES